MFGSYSVILSDKSLFEVIQGHYQLHISAVYGVIHYDSIPDQQQEANCQEMSWSQSEHSCHMLVVSAKVHEKNPVVYERRSSAHTISAQGTSGMKKADLVQVDDAKLLHMACVSLQKRCANVMFIIMNFESVHSVSK
ncbi:uncharacterized protein LOC110833959 isoform X2 [Zootermopsis nevadensis]|uniref:uncharacterized protein LOC110833959 isoform X2 n=1 Tax=Zootermopsis nevadensis TaxID=136037 RepID=UPI000B8E6E14|nr:uncharacterized protein LOC110833959 isoform X2 [Zootermopsis nevadensis]